jgi:hypothetical protein
VFVVGDRLAVRVWRVVRRPATVRPVTVRAATDGAGGFAPPARRRAGRSRAQRYCNASGWQMRAGCGDGDGGTICPLCSQRVRTQPDAVINRGIEVIQAHCA